MTRRLPRVRAATRGSVLARTQTAMVASLLERDVDEVEVVVVTTAGDRHHDVPIWALGGQGAFVREVQLAVLEGRADIAVHSAKDLPSKSADGLTIGAVPGRGDARDALVGSTLDGLPVGGRVGTGSVRRRAQLAWLRPDLIFGELRGNIDTRLARAGDFDAVVVAAAALERLGRSPETVEVLDPEVLLPQVGQGALAVECRADDDDLRQVLAGIDHPASRRAVEAERAYLAEVGGGCQLPVGAYGVTEDGDTIRLTALLASGDGHIVVRHADEGSDPRELGTRVARYLLDRCGGDMLLAEAAPS